MPGEDKGREGGPLEGTMAKAKALRQLYGLLHSEEEAPSPLAWIPEQQRLLVVYQLRRLFHKFLASRGPAAQGLVQSHMIVIQDFLQLASFLCFFPPIVEVGLGPGPSALQATNPLLGLEPVVVHHEKCLACLLTAGPRSQR